MRRYGLSSRKFTSASCFARLSRTPPSPKDAQLAASDPERDPRPSPPPPGSTTRLVRPVQRPTPRLPASSPQARRRALARSPAGPPAPPTPRPARSPRAARSPRRGGGGRGRAGGPGQGPAPPPLPRETHPAPPQARGGEAQAAGRERGRKLTRRFSAAAGRGARSRRPFKQKKPLLLPAAPGTPAPRPRRPTHFAGPR